MISLTVVMPNYNRPKMILPVLDSIVNQPLRDVKLDILIIDDCSPNPIEPKDLEKYGDRVKVHRLEKNSGVVHARNVGIAMATGDLILLADDDDLFIPNALQKAVDLITALDDYDQYRGYGFPRTDAIDLPLPDFCFANSDTFVFAREFYSIYGGNLTAIINKKFVDPKKPLFLEENSIASIGGESLWDYGAAIQGTPYWKFAIVKSNCDQTRDSLTNPINTIRKAKAFVSLHQAELDMLEKTGFDKKMPRYYTLKIKGLYTYLLLDGRREEALAVLRKYQLHPLTKIAFYAIGGLSQSMIYRCLRLYRKIQNSPPVRSIGKLRAKRAAAKLFGSQTIKSAQK
ncbi:hypothetical protein AGMMS50229_06100 [Campylobacterota bacterium]|nr:hypothetical protein AGMMS50229_06100 [Campylobacterota bacterium]